ncbi:MAG: N-acetylmuramoyl-L-alanine amidase [Bacteroidales bacterium]|jgi:N-acetylmuramoyl-L-alanine amidase
MKKILIIVVLINLFSNLFSQNYIVVLDAGHGGKDPGAIYGNVREKDITLSIALEVGKILTNKYNNLKVIYTRQSDIFVPLIERTRIANKEHANLFVSFHVNASKSPEPSGYEVYVMGNAKVKDWLETAIAENSVAIYEDNYLESYDGIDPNSTEGYIAFSLYQNQFLDKSLILADKVTSSTLQVAPFMNRGIKQAPFFVLYKATMPSILIEMGFITNQQDRTWITNKDNQKKIANNIANAIADYIIDVDNFPLVETTTAANIDTTITVTSELIYYIQFLSSSEKLSNNHKIYKDFPSDSVSYYSFNNAYRYIYGHFTNFNQARDKLNYVKQKGYKDAFIVKFKDGQRVF